MPEWVWFTIAYLIGSLPTGLLLSKAAGLGDIRNIGSGNIGATNVLRTGRKGVAAATLCLDVLKGATPSFLALIAFPNLAPWVGLCAILGHNFPVWLKFKGGKGVATTLGVFLALQPFLAMLLILTWGITFWFSRMSSVASIVSAICAPLFGYLIIDSHFFWMVLALSTLLIIRHHSNIKRLVLGEEHQVSEHSSS